MMCGSFLSSTSGPPRTLPLFYPFFIRVFLSFRSSHVRVLDFDRGPRLLYHAGFVRFAFDLPTMTQRYISRRHTPTRHFTHFHVLACLPNFCAFCRFFTRDPFPTSPGRDHTIKLTQAPYPRTTVFPYPCSKSFVFLSPGPAHLPRSMRANRSRPQYIRASFSTSHVANFFFLSPLGH